ncbi:MAG: cytochrome c3 family protein [Planctomycetota bacterium]|jgi:cytochrome c nitrite reductase small subunit
MMVFAGKIVSKLVRVVRRHSVGFSVGLLSAILCFLAIDTVAGRFSASEYCGSKCHEMTGAYQSWELSPHYANDSGVVAECVDCHLPSKDDFFTHVTAKAYIGLKDTYKHHFGGEYDAEKMRNKVLEEMPNERCLDCHSNLLAKPRSSAAEEDVKPRCVECHEKLHERERKVFSPE